MVFRKKKVMVIEEITEGMGCSIPTVRRRLKQWNSYSSYNHNGRYYTLGRVARFDVRGLWKHRGIFFSRHGTLRETVVRLIDGSPCGFKVKELESCLGVCLGSFMPSLRTCDKLHREKIGGCHVYFSAEEKISVVQRKKRFEQMEQTQRNKLPTDAMGVVILVEKIKHPHLAAEQLAGRLQGKGHRIGVASIRHLFAHHGLVKKTVLGLT